MSRRLFQVLGVAAVLLLVALLLRLARAPLDARTPVAGASPATAWGEPDLQGIWTRTTNEPLQRPARFKDREFLTDEERAELDNKISDIVGRESDENRLIAMAFTHKLANIELATKFHLSGTLVT